MRTTLFLLKFLLLFKIKRKRCMFVRKKVTHGVNTLLEWPLWLLELMSSQEIIQPPFPDTSNQWVFGGRQKWSTWCAWYDTPHVSSSLTNKPLRTALGLDISTPTLVKRLLQGYREGASGRTPQTFSFRIGHLCVSTLHTWPFFSSQLCSGRIFSLKVTCHKILLFWNKNI